MLTVTSYNGEYDRSIIREVPREYAGVTQAVRGRTVLDIGAHIGCFAVHAFNCGAGKIVCLEPGSPSFKHLKKNTAPMGDRCQIFHAGVTATPGQQTITLRYLGHGRSMAGAKTVTDRSKKEWSGIPFKYETVPAMQFSDLLREHRPSVVKLDCEGPEYDCVGSTATMPKFVKCIVVEWHKTAGRTIQRYLTCTEKLRNWGFVPEKEPNLVVKYRDGEAVGSNQFFIRPIAWHRR